MDFSVLLIVIAFTTNVLFYHSTQAQTVQLVGGARPSEGRVEVRESVDDEWGTVCDDRWTLTEATVVCQQLGFVGADDVRIGAAFGEGTGDIVLDNVACLGTEADLFACTHNDVGVTDCTHAEDVGVVCTSTGSLRLVPIGDSDRIGRVEILTDTREWARVCRDGLTPFSTGMVVCRQLGFPALEYAWPEDVNDLYNVSVPDGTGDLRVGGFQCSSEGTEERLELCPIDQNFDPATCSEDFGVKCVHRSYIGPLGTYTGKPYVYYGGKWGSICVSGWTSAAARVFCRTLGSSGLIYSSVADTSDSDLAWPEINVSPIGCQGEEDSFSECPALQWADDEGCNGDTVSAHVTCESEVPKEIRIEPYGMISGQLFPEYGRVVFSFPGTGLPTTDGFPICHQTWTDDDSDVACQTAGFRRGSLETFTQGGSDTSLVVSLECSGSDLIKCTTELVPATSDCSHSNDVGVKCQPNDEDVFTFLSGGVSSQGVVQYRSVKDLETYVLCDENWSDEEATVVCKMSGYQGGAKSTTLASLPAPDSELIFRERYDCEGPETRLEDCPTMVLGANQTCDPENVAQVTCTAGNSDTRMVGSEFSEQGRVEYRAGGAWGSIVSTAALGDYLCKNLGYERSLQTYYNDAASPFGVGTGQVAECLVQTKLFDRYYECANDLVDLGGSTRTEVGVVCQPYEFLANHPIRLVSADGEANIETGRLEIYHDGEWGAICHNNQPGLALTVCRELGYNDTYASEYGKPVVGSAAAAYLDAEFKTWFKISTPSTCNGPLYTCDHTAWGHVPDDCDTAVITCVNAATRVLFGWNILLVVLVAVKITF